MYRASSLQSVQYGSCAFAQTDTAKTATITAVVVANSVVEMIGFTTSAGAGATPDVVLPNVVLTNTTTITANRTTAANNSLVVYFKVIEFVTGQIKSKQEVSIALTGVTSNTATITSVNTAKTVIYRRGQIATDTTANAVLQHVTGLTLTNATTVTAAQGATGGTTTAVGTVVELTR